MVITDTVSGFVLHRLGFVLHRAGFVLHKAGLVLHLAGFVLHKAGFCSAHWFSWGVTLVITDTVLSF